MSMATALTFDTADAKEKPAGGSFDMTVIITMNRQATGVTAGAGELVELEVINHFIIKTWCKGIVFFDE